MTMPQTVHVIGAAGRSGQVLCRALAARKVAVVKLARRPLPDARIADLTDPHALRAGLHDATHIVSCAHARHSAAIIAAAPQAARLVLLGSTRKFTRWPDDHGNGVLAGEAALLASGRQGVMLHPTMIYGAQGEDNVQRLATLLRRLPSKLPVPLPGGGRALVQPIHQDDVTACILAALAHDWSGPHSLVTAGPRALPYADFVRAIARAAGLRAPRFLPVPLPPLLAAAALLRLLPALPRIRAAELRRLGEDKAFDIGPMQAVLGVVPRPLEAGLAQTFSRAGNPPPG